MRDSTTNDQTLSPGLTEKITAILSDKVIFALLFGSSVTGRLTSESDIVDLRSSSSILFEEVQREGVIVWND
jgi:hypothetical protein